MVGLIVGHQEDDLTYQSRNYESENFLRIAKTKTNSELVMKQFGINWKERCQPWKQKRLVEWKTIEIFHGKEFLKKGNRNRAFQWGSEDPRTMFLTQCNAWAIHNFTWLESTSHGWSFSSPKSFISSCSPSVPVLICSSTVKLDWFSASRFWIPRACLWTHLLATNQKRKFTGFWNRQIYHQYLWWHTWRYTEQLVLGNFV